MCSAFSHIDLIELSLAVSHCEVQLLDVRIMCTRQTKFDFRRDLTMTHSSLRGCASSVGQCLSFGFYCSQHTHFLGFDQHLRWFFRSLD